MILNVSSRTDIVAFYTEWFMNRYKEGYVDVRNPFYKKNITRIYFKDVDAILFCTKNPIPIIKYLKEIKEPILFHITLTPYKKDIEPNVPPKGQIIKAIKQISKIIGKENLYIRYDPILINEKYTIEYHIKSFDHMCELLNGYTEKIIISFIDDYKNVRNNNLKYEKLTNKHYEQIGINFSKSAKKYNMTVQTCCEENNLTQYGFIKDECISFNKIFKMTNKTNLEKWKERPCNCVKTIDIGEYNTCNHMCKYCYANYNQKEVIKNIKEHDKNSSLLIGKINKFDIIKIKED